MEYDILDKLFPQSGENPRELQTKIDSFLSIYKDVDENSFNEILAGIEMEGFRKGLRTGIKLCCELMDSERYT